jgi:hypothetical protein
MSDPADLAAADITLVPLDRIPIAEGAQTRAKVRPDVVRAYAAAMKEQLAQGGLRFPPVALFSAGRDYWIGDGFHRLLAARQAGLTAIAAAVRPGTPRDALLFGVAANADHGLPRTNPDKRKAVALLLADPQWGQWNDREIARRCRVDRTMVRRMRRRASGAERQIEERKARRGDTVFEMKVGPRGAAGAETTPAAPPATDPLGLPLPEPRADVFAALSDFQEAKDLFDRLAQTLDRIARGPAGELYRREMIRTADNGTLGFACAALRACRNRLLAAEPYCAYCPLCHPAHPDRVRPGCKTCGGRGWTTRAAFEACAAADRQALLRLRTSNPMAPAAQ